MPVFHQRLEKLGDNRGHLGDLCGAQFENPQLDRFLTVACVQFTNHGSRRRDGFFRAGENKAVAGLVHQQGELVAGDAGVETFLDQPGHHLGIGRAEADNLRHPLATGGLIGRTEHVDQLLHLGNFLLRAADDDPVVFAVGDQYGGRGQATGVVAHLRLIKLAGRLDDAVRLAKRDDDDFHLMRAQVLPAGAVVRDHLLDLPILRIGADNDQSRTLFVRENLRLGAVRRNLFVEQSLGQLEHLRRVAVLQSQHAHLPRHRLGCSGDSGHDLLNDRKLLLGRGHDQAAARLVRQDHWLGQFREFRIQHLLIDQFLNRLQRLVELARLAAWQTNDAHLPGHDDRAGGLIFLEECRDATVLLPGGQNDQPLASRVLDDLRRRSGAWLVVVKKPRDQRSHLGGIGAIEVHKPHRALRRVRKHVERLHHLRNHLVLLDVGSNNHPVVHPVLNQARLGLIAERCFPHPFVHQRLDVAINLVHLAVGQGQHCGGSRLGQGLGQAKVGDQLLDLLEMIRLGTDDQSMCVFVTQNDGIGRA